MNDELDIKSLVAELRVVRVRYELPDTSAFVRYQPAYDEDPNNLKVHHYDGELPLSCSETGTFNLKELVNELRYAYVLVHLFPDESAMNFYLTGLDTGLAQLEFIGGSYDFNRLWDHQRYLQSGRAHGHLPWQASRREWPALGFAGGSPRTGGRQTGLSCHRRWPVIMWAKTFSTTTKEAGCEQAKGY